MSELALLGGKPVRDVDFPAWPQYDDREREALLEVLESRVWCRTQGTRAFEFEEAFAAYHGARHGIATANGTAALEVTMAALGIGSGDEVILPDYTYFATASAILFAGALPVPVDVTADTYCLAPELVEAAITERTKAVIVVHMGGHPADLDCLSKLARQHNLFLIEDSSHAHGSEWKGKKVGARGDIGTFSFQQSKLMTAGEGGIIITNDDELARRARSVHDAGRRLGGGQYEHLIYGSNYRLSEWHAALLSQQLSRLDEQAALRTENATYLDQAFEEIEGITPQSTDHRCTRHGRYAYIFHYDREAFAGVPTERFIQALNAEGIPTQLSYPPIHELPVFLNEEYRSRLCPEQQNAEHVFLKAKFPNTVRAAREAVWLPHRVLLGTSHDIDDILRAIRKIQKHAEELLFTA